MRGGAGAVRNSRLELEGLTRPGVKGDRVITKP